MRERIAAATRLYPMPVLIVGTYDENGRIDAKKLDHLLCIGVTRAYWFFYEKVGQAFSDRKKIKK